MKIKITSKEKIPNEVERDYPCLLKNAAFDVIYLALSKSIGYNLSSNNLIHFPPTIHGFNNNVNFVPFKGKVELSQWELKLVRNIN